MKDKTHLNRKLPVNSIVERVAQYEVVTNFFPVVTEINFLINSGVEIPLKDYLIYVSSVNGVDVGDELILNHWYKPNFPGQFKYLPPMEAGVEQSVAKINFAPGISELRWGVLPWGDAALLKPVPFMEIKMDCKLKDTLDRRVKGMMIVKELEK